MNKNIKDIETILDFAGCYEWNDKLMIVKTNEGYDVNGLSFATLKAACDFIESFPHNSFASKTAQMPKPKAKESADQNYPRI